MKRSSIVVINAIILQENLKKWLKIDVFVIIMIKEVNPKLTVLSKLIVLVFRE